MMTEKSCDRFLDELASSAPVPGGGGASAVCGAMGTALASMVANLTSGKKKYAAYQQDIESLLARSEKLRRELAALADKDAQAFEPLSKAYGLPKDTDEERGIRDRIMEDALKKASEVPLEIMEKACEAISLHTELAVKGSRIAVSDVGVGALFCKSALMGASLNVFINTKLMKDRAAAAALERRADELIAKGCAEADAAYAKVVDAIR
jgi:formiminotetrahydrofolate cyclodeaminase